VDGDGTLYGFGCRRYGASTLFAVTPDNQSFWYGDIPGTDGGNCNPDSGSGNALISGGDGLFYGTANVGGAAHLGSIFSVGPDLQTSYTILHEFTEGPDGCFPTAGLVQADDGNFYGTTPNGCGSGGGSGTVFQLTPDGTFTTIHAFGIADGQNPYGPLIQASDGLLYGTTLSGDSTMVGGTVFRMTLDGTETILHVFPYGTLLGARPRAGLVQASDGYLYGRTWEGGQPDMFRMSLDGTEFATLHSFLSGSLPHFSVVEGLNQNLYGLVAGDPSADLGTIFSVTPTGSFSVLQIMPPFYRPYNGPLVVGLDGALYGTTPTATATYPGAVFRFGSLQ
jgi:uncharacterized repeat protein (TIGR03803 family)